MLKHSRFGIAFTVEAAIYFDTYNEVNYWERGPMIPPCNPLRRFLYTSLLFILLVPT